MAMEEEYNDIPCYKEDPKSFPASVKNEQSY